jgi:hypothetical protein
MVLVPAAAQASVIVSGTGGYGYQPVSPGFVLNENGTPFWDNKSLDGSNLNVGFFLTKTGGFSSHPSSPAIAATVLEFWGNAGGAADSVQKFSSGGFGVDTKLVLTVAGNAGKNKLGYRDSIGDHIIYDPAVDGKVAGQTKTFTPVGEFAFFMENASAGYKFYSDTGIAGHTDGTQQHFALFRDTLTGLLWIGIEDLPGTGHGEGQGDYNDLVFSVKAAPEPASLTAFGIGAAGLVLYGWRKRRLRLA